MLRDSYGSTTSDAVFGVNILGVRGVRERRKEYDFEKFSWRKDVT